MKRANIEKLLDELLDADRVANNAYVDWVNYQSEVHEVLLNEAIEKRVALYSTIIDLIPTED